MVSKNVTGKDNSKLRIVTQRHPFFHSPTERKRLLETEHERNALKSNQGPAPDRKAVFGPSYQTGLKSVRALAEVACSLVTASRSPGPVCPFLPVNTKWYPSNYLLTCSII